MKPACYAGLNQQQPISPAYDLSSFMKTKLTSLSQRYLTALRTHLKQGPGGSLLSAHRLGRQAVVLRVETLGLPRIHERAIVILELSKGKAGLIKQAELFFTEAIIPITATHQAARQSRADLDEANTMLERRTLQLATANLHLQRGINQRKGVETALKKSDEHYSKLLKDSLNLQEVLRQLTRQVLTMQEDERQKISRELQDEIAQTLLGINVRLISLKQEALKNTTGLKKEIASTQQLVVKSAKSVERASRRFNKS